MTSPPTPHLQTHSPQLPDTEKRIAPLAYAAYLSAVPILFLPFLFPIPLTLGILALRSIKKKPQYVGKGRAFFGIAWGIIGVLLTVFVIAIKINK